MAAGPVTFTTPNAGSTPPALEVEGERIERETPATGPGATATLALTLKPGTYELYCPVGNDSHKRLGMETHLTVAGSGSAGAPGAVEYGTNALGGSPAPAAESVQVIRVTGGGPVIQILPGPFPFPDSAAPILQAFGDEREGLESQVKNGPYSNNVARSSGSFTFTARDKGATRDSVDGLAEFTTQDGARC